MTLLSGVECMHNKLGISIIIEVDFLLVSKVRADIITVSMVILFRLTFSLSEGHLIYV